MDQSDDCTGLLHCNYCRRKVIAMQAKTLDITGPGGSRSAQARQLSKSALPRSCRLMAYFSFGALASSNCSAGSLTRSNRIGKIRLEKSEAAEAFT